MSCEITIFSGTKVRCLHDYAKPTMRDFNPSQTILHVGTNDLNSEKNLAKLQIPSSTFAIN